MQDKKAITTLYYKYIDGTLSAEELLEWIEAFHNPENQTLINTLMEESFHTKTTSSKPAEAQQAFQKFSKTVGIRSSYRKRQSRHYWAAAAAAAAILVFGGVLTYSYQHRLFKPEQQITLKDSVQDIAPGSTDKAILYLKDGQQIALDAQGELVIGADGLQDGDGNLVAATKEESTTQTIEVPLGGQYQIRLPDGSKIWLNALSKLTFPTLFKANTREVSLQGEAYFEVAKNKSKPFIVHTDVQQVQVLGTSFNLNSYDPQNHITTLVSGSLSVSSHGQQVLLSPGMQSHIQGSQLLTEKVDTEAVSAWKDGLFVFTKEPLESIIKKLERWYDAEFIFQPGSESLRTKTFSGSLSRQSNLSELIHLFKITESIHCEIKGRRVYLSK